MLFSSLRRFVTPSSTVDEASEPNLHGHVPALDAFAAWRSWV